MQNRKELPVRGVRSHDVDRSSADNHGAVPVRHMSCNDDLDTPLGQPVLHLNAGLKKIGKMYELAKRVVDRKGKNEVLRIADLANE